MISGHLREKQRACIRYFDRQSPQAYSVSRSRLWAQRCGYGTGETGGHRSLGGCQVHRREYRGQPALCWSQGAAPFGRVQGGSACAAWRGGEPFLRCPEVENLGPGKVDACVNLYWVYYLTQTFAGSAAPPPFPGPGTSSQEGGKLFETDTTQRALRQAWHLQSPP